MKIVITGPKASGKTTIGKIAAERLGAPLVETDALIEDIYSESRGEKLTCREIWKAVGEEEFRRLEREACKLAAEMEWRIISTGGSTMLSHEARKLLRQNAIVILLTAPLDALWQRMVEIGLPPFLSGENAKAELAARLERQFEAVQPIIDSVIDTSQFTIEAAADEVVNAIVENMALRANAPNTFGEIFRVTTFGESHGPAIGAVLDGVPPGIEITESDIQQELSRRRPGQSNVTTSRNEPDQVHIMSGVFEGKTTGTPICLLIYNQDQDSSKYDSLKTVFRPGHADFTFWHKYGIRDHKGGGRSSGRETAARVAGGAVAKKILRERGIEITAYALEIAGIRAEEIDLDQIEKNPIRSPDAKVALRMEQAVLDARQAGDSVGGIVELIISGAPIGLGDPVFWKLDARLGAAIMSLGAVKGIEIGAGFESARMKGSQFNDPMRGGEFVTNNAGGILGGISNGQEIMAKIAIKPTPSISRAQQTSDINGADVEINIEGRHDPCIVPRAIPVIENMAALVILDALRIQERIGSRR